MATLPQIFRRLTDEVVDVSYEVYFSEGEDEIAIYKTSDLIAYIDKQYDERIALEFVLFDEEMYLTPGGDISILPRDSDEPMMLDDPDIIKTIGQYLAWRLKAIVYLGI